MRREGVHTITSGSSATVNNGAGTVYMDLASLAASFIPGGTISTGTVVTLFTLSANSGQAILGTALTSVAFVVGTIPMYQWRLANSKWYKLQ